MKDITCISDIYYKIGNWFTLIMFIIAIETLPFALEIWESMWSFLMCAGIMFVGLAGKYKDTFEGKIHYVAACTSTICSIIWILNVCPLALLLLILSIIALFDKKRWLLWCEISCIVMVYVTLICELI